jgi:hypothetical protein
MDLLFIEVLAIIVLESSQELIKLSVDKLDDIWFLKPDEKWASDIFEIEGIRDTIWIIPIIAISTTILSTESFSHHSESLLSDLLLNEFILFIIFVHKSSWSSASHVSLKSCLLLQLSVDFSSSLQREFALNEVIDTLSLIIVEFRNSVVVVLHVLKEIVTLWFDIRVSALVIIVLIVKVVIFKSLIGIISLVVTL